MRTAIFYFSGTGNTERVVNAWLSALNTEGIGVEAFRIEDARDVDLTTYDKLGIAYPIHAFNAPEIVLDFAKRLPVFFDPKAVYLIMVSGEPLRLNDSSDQKLRKILKSKNARAESAWHYIMPYNMIFRHTEARAWQMYDTMRKLVPLDVRQYFIEGKPHTLHPLRGTGVLTVAFRIEQWFSHANGKHFRVTKECVHCMQCVKSCPTGNIEWRDGKLLFHDRCILCTRCSFYCPKDAIRIGLLYGWRVNGPYCFRPPIETEPDTHANFCHRSYERYFRDAEQQIQENKNHRNSEGAR